MNQLKSPEDGSDPLACLSQDEADSASGSLMETSLYRKIALDSARSRVSTPVKLYGVSSWVITSLLISIAIAVGVLLIAAQYTRTETANGTLIAASGTVRVTAPKSGIAEEVFVKDGDSVKVGDAIASVSYDAIASDGVSVTSMMNEVMATVEDAQVSQSTARLEQIDSQVAELQERLLVARREKGRLGEQRDIQQRRVQIAQQTVDATQHLFERQLIATVQMRQREDALLAAQQALLNTARDIDDHGIMVVQLASQIRQMEAKRSGEQGAALEAKAQRRERRVSLETTDGGLLRATRAGVLSALNIKSGDAVQNGQTVASIYPVDGGLAAELWVSSRSIGFVRPGNEVRIRYDAFPYQRFGVGKGRVVSVGRAPVQPADLDPALASEEPLYRVTVRVDRQTVDAFGQSWPLVPGMKISGDLILDRRPLYYRVIEPFMAMRAGI